MHKKKILITGVAGFIGLNLSFKLINKKFNVYGIDNMSKDNNFFIKKKRKKEFIKFGGKFFKLDLCDYRKLAKFCNREKFEFIINLAASTGVRESVKFPKKYIKNNTLGFFNLLDICKINSTKLIYASSSSVYGKKSKIPFDEKKEISFPQNIYAFSKQSNESMAKTYKYLHNYKTLGLRFFTVYGPWGRPDMAIYKFTKNIILGKKIEVFNKGKLSRDFTFVDDITDAILNCLQKYNLIVKNDEILNVGGGKTYNVLNLIKMIESLINKKAKIIFKKQPGELKKTLASNNRIKKITKTKKFTDLKTGLSLFYQWFKNTNQIKI